MRPSAALRLAYATSEAKADAAGWWEDPSLDVDWLRLKVSDPSGRVRVVGLVAHPDLDTFAPRYENQVWNS